MAVQLTDEKMKMGSLVPVQNLTPKLNASTTYYNLKVEDEDGGNERILLITPSGVERLKRFKLGEWQSMMKPGRLYEFSRYGHKEKCYLVLIRVKGEDRVVRVGEWYLRDGLQRALANPEDVIKQSFLADAMD